MADGWSVLFIDVGYLLAAVGEVQLGTVTRSEIRCDYGGFIPALTSRVREVSEWPVLRTYWYDASVGGQPTAEHDRIAILSGVKLRLGRLVRGSQKGVDSRIVRDLIVLAEDRVMRVAYLIAGDEDVREGVSEAQDRGVKVVLLGIEGMTPSYTLVQEADEYVVLPRSFWRPWFASDTAAPAGKGALRRYDQVDGLDAAASSAIRMGRKFAEDWSRASGRSEVDAVMAQDGWIPPEVHAQLLREAEAELGPLWERADLKQALRNGFWDGLRGMHQRPQSNDPTLTDDSRQT